MKNQEQDLTVGSVPQKLIRFAVPLLGANLLQSLYSIADMLVVGRVVGKAGLAAISNASMLSFIINSICIGVTMGGTVLAAQYKGANDEQGQKETIGTLFSLSFIASILVTAAGLLLYSHLFSLLHVPVEAFAYERIWRFQKPVILCGGSCSYKCFFRFVASGTDGDGYKGCCLCYYFCTEDSPGCFSYTFEAKGFYI